MGRGRKVLRVRSGVGSSVWIWTGRRMIAGSVLWCLGESYEWARGESHRAVRENSVMWGILATAMLGWQPEGVWLELSSS